MGANRELVERSFAAENRGDFEAAASLYAPDATYVDPLIEPWPDGSCDQRVLAEPCEAPAGLR